MHIRPEDCLQDGFPKPAPWRGRLHIPKKKALFHFFLGNLSIACSILGCKYPIMAQDTSAWDCRKCRTFKAKVRMFMGKSTDVCIKEVRCFGFPDWGLVSTIGSDRDIANESAYDKQQYDANRNGIPSVTYLSQVEPRQGGLTTRYRVLWI